MPLVSVLMPAYNASRFVSGAVESILSQTLTDFEFLIGDDASEDSTLAILSSFADPRIHVTRNPVNAGVSATLNALLELARGKYIARMDADDLSHPLRLARQVEFMESHPAVGVCGTWCRGFGILHAVDFKPPVSDGDLRFEMFFGNPIPHPTVMMRRAVFEASSLRYDPEFLGAEDYDLWRRALDHCELAVLPIGLLDYRFHDEQATSRRMEVQRRCANAVRRKLAMRLVPDASERELELHDGLFSNRATPSAEWISDAGIWLSKLAAANRAMRLYPENPFERRLARILWGSAYSVAARTRGAWSSVKNARIAGAAGHGIVERLRLRLRSAAAYLPRD